MVIDLRGHSIRKDLNVVEREPKENMMVFLRQRREILSAIHFDEKSARKSGIAQGICCSYGGCDWLLRVLQRPRAREASSRASDAIRYSDHRTERGLTTPTLKTQRRLLTEPPARIKLSKTLRHFLRVVTGAFDVHGLVAPLGFKIEQQPEVEQCHHRRHY